MLTVAKRPCKSCPYRKDVPSGVWAPHEYDKLPAYDGLTALQDPRAFQCHLGNEKVCAGWLACHGTDGPNALLAMRLVGFFSRVDPKLFNYRTDVELFASGAEARAHGLRDIEQPDEAAQKTVAKLIRLGKSTG
jgi:hypothetical protein